MEIQEQPFRIIVLLAQRSGELISREELQQTLWAGDTFVDFEAGLKSAIWKARQALGDVAANPRFIETVPRQGYRFIAPVTYEMASFTESADRGAGLVLTPRRTPLEEEKLEAATPRPAQVMVPRPAERRRSVWPIVAAFSTAALLGSGILIWSRIYPSPPVLDRLRPFANAHGNQSRPAFSPNGEMVAFDWMGPSDRHTCIYVQRLDASTRARLTSGLAEEIRPVWSNDGSKIAFLRNISENQYGILSVPVVGKGERLWVQFRKGATAWFDWSPDGKWFAFAEPVVPNHSPSIVILSIVSGERRVLTIPPLGWRGDSEPTFSPDSSRVAFRRTMEASGVEDVYMVPIAGGEPTRVTFDNRTVSTLAFTPDSGLIFSSARSGTNRSLWWRAPGGGDLHRLTAATVDAVTPTVSRDGKHFAFSKVQVDLNVWRVNADGSGAATSLIDSELNDSSPNFSPDGRRILFQSSRTGSSDIWVCDADGSEAVRLTDTRGAPIGDAKWSPDGRRIAYDWRPAGKGAIYLMAADGGSAKALVADANQNWVPSWSHDGRFIYFASNRTGRSEIWKISVDGGPAVQLTKQGGFAPQESPDEKFLYYFLGTAVWRIPLAGGMPSAPESKVHELASTSGDWGNWFPTNDGLYSIRRQHGGGAIEYYDFARRTSHTVYEMPRPPVFGGSGLTLSPDNKTLLFVEVDRDESSIYVQ